MAAGKHDQPTPETLAEPLWDSGWAEQGLYDSTFSGDRGLAELDAAIAFLEASMDAEGMAKARVLALVREERGRRRATLANAAGARAFAAVAGRASASPAPCVSFCQLRHDHGGRPARWVVEHGFDARAALSPLEPCERHRLWVGPAGDVISEEEREGSTLVRTVRLWKESAGPWERRQCERAWAGGALDARTLSRHTEGSGGLLGHRAPRRGGPSAA